VPGQAEILFLIPGSHKILIWWTKPKINEYCVTQYVIQWAKYPNTSIKSSNVSKDDNSFVIEGLDPGVEYEVSVTAINEEEGFTYAAKSKMITEYDGNYKNLLLCQFVKRVRIH
jgi:hypothetical protein